MVSGLWKAEISERTPPVQGGVRLRVHRIDGILQPGMGGAGMGGVGMGGAGKDRPGKVAEGYFFGAPFLAGSAGTGSPPPDSSGAMSAPFSMNWPASVSSIL